MRRLTRRDVLKAAPFTALPLIGRTYADDARGFPGMTVRMQEPQNLEFPFSELSSWLTPTEHFYVRSHFAVPKVETWMGKPVAYAWIILSWPMTRPT